MEGIFHLDIWIDEHFSESDVKRVFAKVCPEWNDWKQICVKTFTTGITNKITGYYHETDTKWENMVLIRRYGEKTEKIVDRKSEIRNLSLMHSQGCGPQLFAVLPNALVYGFIPGTVCDGKMFKDPLISTLIAQATAQMHLIDISNNPDFDKSVPSFFSKCELFLRNIPETFSKPSNQERMLKCPYTLQGLESEFHLLKETILSNAKSPLGFCHNDLLQENVVYSKSDGKVTFIDYEYGDYNYEYFDIGNHFAEFVGVGSVDRSNFPNKSFRKKWLQEYFSHKLKLQGKDNSCVTDEFLENVFNEVNLFILCGNYFWGIWALVQTEISNIDFDYLDYGIMKLEEYFAYKEEFLAYTRH